MKKISVCVPTYNRPEMLKPLISSFLKQDHECKELVIADDSSDSRTQELISHYQSDSITYIKNPENLGYCANLLASLTYAKGDFLLILGDDDMLAHPNALSRYVSVFEQNPSVGYVYSNQIQFSNSLDVDCLIQHFKKDQYYPKGKSAMEGIWMTSIFIPGIGIRNDKNLLKYYPKKTMLFPQTELVGHIINLYDAYGISDVLIAGRSHDQQLGFQAILKKDIKGPEKHGTLEVLAIYDRLQSHYHFAEMRRLFESSLVNAYSFMVFKEKMLIGNAGIRENYASFCDISPMAKNSLKLRLSYCFALISPSWILKIARKCLLAIYFMKNGKILKNYQKNIRALI